MTTANRPIGYKLFISDLDGTLLGPDGQVTERARKAVIGIRESGAQFTLATARSMKDAQAFSTILGITEPVICQNGAIIYSPSLNAVLNRSLLRRNHTATVVTEVRLAYPDAAIAIDYPRMRLVDPSWPGPFGRNPSQFALWPIAAKDLTNLRASTVMVRTSIRDGGRTLRTRLAAHSDVKFTITSSHPSLIEIGSSRADKRYAVAKLCRTMGVEPDEVVAFGDMPNDMGMLAISGWGIAPANAHEAVRAIADAVIGSNADDGVAEYLEGLIEDPRG